MGSPKLLKPSRQISIHAGFPVASLFSLWDQAVDWVDRQHSSLIMCVECHHITEAQQQYIIIIIISLNTPFLRQQINFCDLLNGIDYTVIL